MKNTFNRKLIFLSTVITILSSFLLHIFYPVIENLLYDMSLSFSKKSSPDSVIIVGIDSKSINEHGILPWKRSLFAQMITNISKQNPKTVALDFIFPKNSSDSLGNDSLRNTFLNTEGLVLGIRMDNVTSKQVPKAPVISADAYVHRFLLLNNQNNLNSLAGYSAGRIDIGDGTITRHAKRAGFLNVSTSRHTLKIRKLVHVIKSGNEFYPSFGVAAAAQFFNLNTENFVLDGEGFIKLGARKLPIERGSSSCLLNFYGPSGSIKTYSASDVINGTIPDTTFSDKLVFVGITETPALPSDFFPTPVGIQFPGVELWATSAANIIENSWIRKNTLSTTFGILFFLLINPGLFIILKPKHKKSIPFIAVATFLISLIIGVILINRFNIFWNSGIHLYALLSVIFLSTIWKYNIIVVKKNSLTLYPDYDSTKLTKLMPDNLTNIPDVPTAMFIKNLLLEEPDNNKNILDRFISLDDKQIVTYLGSGGMADVYLSWHPRMEVYRALKVIKPDQPQQWLDLFETEIKIFSSLNHSNIVQCYGVGFWQKLPYLEMEYINGKSFEDIINNTGPISIKHGLAVTILCCKALTYAHNCSITIYGKKYHGVIHRDLKPANIMISQEGNIKITDFGIAKPGADSIEKSKEKKILGTLPYLAPEQLNGDSLSKYTDIYSLGITLYELLTGYKAFPQTTIKEIIDAKLKGNIINPENFKLPENLAAILKKSFSLNPVNRYATAKEMEKELTKLLTDLVGNNDTFILEDLLSKIF